jgi:hypothetical protein
VIGSVGSASVYPRGSVSALPRQELLEDLVPAEDVQQADEAAVVADPLQFTLPGGGKVHGHLAADPQHPVYESTRYPLRTYMLSHDQQVTAVHFQDLHQQLQAGGGYPTEKFSISQDAVDKVVEQSSADRERRLATLSNVETGLRATPKDNSLNPSTVTMFTTSLDEVSGVYAQQLAEIGEVEGFHVRLATNVGAQDALSDELRDAGVQNVSVMGIPGGEVWVEDYGEPLLQKGWVVPAMFEGDWLDETIRESRNERMPDLDISFTQQGQVHLSQLQPAALAKAAATGGVARQALSYLEGGNILTGSRRDGSGYALIGRDSLALTKELLTQQSGSDLTDAQVAEVIGADLGLPAEAVFPMEQPGEFHLDMRMMPLAPGEIALNDAKGAAEQQIGWLRAELERKLADSLIPESEAADLQAEFDERCAALREEAQKRAGYEELTERDLRAAGMKVHRLPGVFVDPDAPSVDTSNFFNARHGVNERGERFSVFMGGKPEEEAFIAEKVLKNADANITRLHFLDPAQTPETLSLWGGLKCRTKPDGELVTPAALQSPTLGRLSA